MEFQNATKEARDQLSKDESIEMSDTKLAAPSVAPMTVVAFVKERETRVGCFACVSAVQFVPTCGGASPGGGGR